MGELQNIKDYKIYKTALDTLMGQTVENFVRIGYLLRIAMDTDILHESGYKNVVEFARAEYNIGKDQVSRFIAINKRFSVGGYSDELQEQYQKFGLAKLQEMLQLPDSIISELSPELTRTEIQQIKKEVQDENKVTDIERMLEPGEAQDKETLREKAMYIYFREHTESYQKMYKTACDDYFSKQDFQQIADSLTQREVMTEFVRIGGIGKVMITLKEDIVTFTNTRSAEKENAGLREVLEDFKKFFRPKYSRDLKQVWQQVYGMEYPEELQQAPPKDTSAEKKPPKEPPKKQPPKPKDVERPEKPKNTINTECGGGSTPNISTTETVDYRGAVFSEMLGVANGLLNCICKKDAEGIREHIKDIEHMLDSLAADNGKDIPGQIELKEIIEDKENA